MKAFPYFGLAVVEVLCVFVCAVVENVICRWVAASVAGVLIIVSARKNRHSNKSLDFYKKLVDTTDRELGIKRDSDGEIISHVRIDGGTYNSDDKVNQDNHENE